MFTFNYSAGASAWKVWLVWIGVFAALFVLNELTRRSKVGGFLAFVVLPIVLSTLWFTVLRDQTYLDWFHLAKVYSSTAGCIGFWCIRFVHGTRKDGSRWHLSEYKWALIFPPLILAINICEAVARDIEVGMKYTGGGFLADENMAYVLGGSWNYMNAAAGILNILTITGFFGICLRKWSKEDTSRDMLWPDMLWFWIVAYDVWNFTYTYNCLPHHSWYCGFALLLAPTLCAFTLGKGAWLQHRAHTLALWCMFAQTVPAFIDKGEFAVHSTYNPTVMWVWGFAALVTNIAVFIFMLYRVWKKKMNPYTNDIYAGLGAYDEVKAMSAPVWEGSKEAVLAAEPATNAPAAKNAG